MKYTLNFLSASELWTPLWTTEMWSYLLVTAAWNVVDIEFVSVLDYTVNRDSDTKLFCTHRVLRVVEQLATTENGHKMAANGCVSGYQLHEEFVVTTQHQKLSNSVRILYLLEAGSRQCTNIQKCSQYKDIAGQWTVLNRYKRTIEDCYLHVKSYITVIVDLIIQ